MRWRMNVSAAATVVKKVASFGALALRCAAGKRAIMLEEASIISAMRRPGKLTCSWVSDEYGSASAMTKNGNPERKSISAPCRTIEVHDPPLQSSTAGNATWVRPALLRVIARPTSTASARPISTTIAMIESSRCVNSRSAARALRHSAITSRMTAGTWVIGTTRGYPAPCRRGGSRAAS